MAIKADIISLTDGYQHLDNVRRIRIVSKTYNLLIMDDYVPIIGEVDGSISFEGDGGLLLSYDPVHGYYRHSRNEFSFMMGV